MSKIISTTYTSGVSLSSTPDDPTTITSTGLLQQGLQVSYAGPWQVMNYGSIQGGSSPDGVLLTGGGTVTNQAGAYIGGGTIGIAAGNGALTVINQGLIAGTSTAGITLGAGGYVGNQSGGVISGYDGILANTAAVTVVNAGTLAGRTPNGAGAFITGGGTVTNQSGGTITGGNGLIAQAVALTVVNAGTIEGQNPSFENYAFGVALLADGYLANQSGGVITAVEAIYADAFATIVNSGSLAGADGINLSSGGDVTNQASGTISGYFAGIAAFRASVTIDNKGTIQASGVGQNGGIRVTAGGEITNQAGGVITGYNGIILNSIAATLVNSGDINGTRTGVALSAHGSVTNQAGGVIAGRVWGVSNGGGSSFVNAGTVLGGTYGVILLGGASSVTNQSSGTITGAKGVDGSLSAPLVNAGSIGSTTNNGVGVYLGGGSIINQASGLITGYYGVKGSGSALSILNAGTVAGGTGFGIGLLAGGNVTNQAGGTISGRLGILDRAHAMTVENAGTIAGTQFAVYFTSGQTNRLIVDPGAVFAGLVSGGDTASGTAVSTLELTSAATSGTLSGLGVQFTGFSQTSIDAGASWTLTGTNTLATGTTLTNAGTLTLLNASLADGGDVVNDGAILIDPSSVTLADLTGTGSTTIEAGSTLDVLGSVSTGQTIVFTGPNDLLGANPAAFAGQINGFTVGDTIQLTGVLDGISAEIVNGNTLQIDRSGNPSVDLTLDPGVSYAGARFAVSPTGAVTETEIPCFLRDTKIRTERGETMVQDLAVGDRVLTLSGVSRPVTWIGTGKVLVSPGKRSAATPIIVQRNALADGVPYYDLRLTKGHALFIDGVLVPAEFLVNHRSIRWDDHKREVAFYHIELDAHDVLLANGAPSESYRDDGNRWLFQNAGASWDLPPKPPCAPVLTGGPVVDAIWHWVLDRTAPRAHLALTGDPDLHLLIDGARVDAVARMDGACVFSLRDIHADVRIVSRAGAPQELGFARDPRRLGIALRHITLRQGGRSRTIEARDPRLTDGFHAFEADPGLRWTDGDATLPATLFEGFDGPFDIQLHLTGTTRYPAFSAAAA